MSRRRSSAGVLLYRLRHGALEVLLAHPGGPYWARKDDGAWTIPKGELEPGEAPEEAAFRELHEETGWTVSGPGHPLGTVRQKSGKVVHAWAVAADVDPDTLVSNQIDIEWPPRSGLRRRIPEVDRAAWFTLDEARVKLMEAQLPLLDRLAEALRQP